MRELSGGEKPKEDVRGLARHDEAPRPALRAAQRAVRRDPDDRRAARASVAPGEKITPARRRARRHAPRVPRDERDQPRDRRHARRARRDGAPHARQARHVVRRSRALRASELAAMLQDFGARFSPSLSHPGPSDASAKRIRFEAIREACELFVRAGHVEARLPGDAGKRAGKLKSALPGAILMVPDEARLSLDLAKNIIVHFFVARGLVATALASAPQSAPMPVERAARARPGALAPLQVRVHVPRRRAVRADLRRDARARWRATARSRASAAAPSRSTRRRRTAPRTSPSTRDAAQLRRGLPRRRARARAPRARPADAEGPRQEGASRAASGCSSPARSSAARR